MKIAVLDIAARNPSQYNPSLCRALTKNNAKNEVVLLSPWLAVEPQGYQFRRLVQLVPQKWVSSTCFMKRILRALEVFTNYLYLLFFILIEKPDILHIQWLPYLDVSSSERLILELLRRINKKGRIVFTVHNLYPHDMAESRRLKYRSRFIRVAGSIDAFIVHLGSTKEQFIKEFQINKASVFVAYHGIYYGQNDSKILSYSHNGKLGLILYGYQSKYKGTDILIDALQQLPESMRCRIEATIVGKAERDFYDKYRKAAEDISINWVNRYVRDEELYEYIASSDVIVLPYREISQSGVLLLALSYKKPLLVSDLPSFRETLEGYPSCFFFEPSNSQALAKAISDIVEKGFDLKIVEDTLQVLNDKYSWEETAKSTVQAYEYALNCNPQWTL